MEIKSNENSGAAAPAAAPKTHWQRQPDSTAHVLLASLVRALTPYVEAAAQTMPAEVTEIAVEMTTAEPTTAHVLCTTPAGVQRFVAVGSGDVGDALALAIGALVTAGLNRLPLETRRRLAPFVEMGHMRLRLEPVFLVVTGSLEMPGADPIAMFTLCGDRTN